MIIVYLLLNYLSWSTVGIRLNLYNTEPTLDIDNLQVNCLHYYAKGFSLVTEKTEYCLGPIHNTYSLNDDFFHLHGQYFTFDQLNQMHVTTNDLLLWSSPIDIAEQYQYYLDHQYNSSLSSELFFNCTNRWFGPRCQFSFDTFPSYSLQLYIAHTLNERHHYKYPYSISHLPCYKHLKCDRGESNICLDWREICDGRIDCMDGGADEKECFELEINECNDNEYRCHNGQCIPKEFLEDNTYECSDQSDIVQTGLNSDVYPFIFNYEEYLCQSKSKYFVCGDGECVADFDQCKNKRHLLLIESIIIQGNLSYSCWITMICFTKILDQINETSCHQLLTSSAINILLENCDDIIQFPQVPVLFGHIYFLYNIKDIKNSNLDFVLIPDYICFDDHLCDFLIPTYRHGKRSCRHYYKFNFDWKIKHQTWSSLIHVVESYFRKCSIRYNNTIPKDSRNLSLYCCKNSTKCISKHRIVDNITDCYLNDDEEQNELSCSLNDVLRFRCGNENKCHTSLVSYDDVCPFSAIRHFHEIWFGEICDRHVHTYPISIDGQNHTDETECEQWICNNYYTRCDGFWSCPNGEDEENCTTQQICPLHFLPCITPYNYTLTCLSASQVNDGKTDCIGAMDERQYCRNLLYFMGINNLLFHCLNDNKCISVNYVCDGDSDCTDGEDETFCHSHLRHGICNEMNDVDRTEVENTICNAMYMEKIPFSLKTSPEYPPSDKKTIQPIIKQSIQQYNIRQTISDELAGSTSLWYCNHGLTVRHWLGGNNYTYKCFCPSSYYGDRCQYQNQRITMTLKVRVMDIHSVYGIVISLIDDNDDQQQIISYHQYTLSLTLECETNIIAYLTYATRPKNNLINYSVRIDVYNKTNLTYLASWHHPVPFSFLPVNRMAVVLYVPSQQVPAIKNCSLICANGKCMKYVNKDKYYCQCADGWSGIRCHISIRCNDCSSDSICVGMIYNRSICVCPLDKGGPRCLLPLSCQEDICINNGTCVVLDDGMNDIGLVCICPKGSFGLTCQFTTWQLEISIDNIKVSSILFIYLFQLQLTESFASIKSQVVVQKLTIFQRTLSVHTYEASDVVLVKTDDKYYLAVLQHTRQYNISTSIDSSRRCANITELFSKEQLSWHEIRRVKYYHQLCQTHVDMICFIDDPYICLCTIEHHANCFRFDSTPPKCRDQSYCENQGTCLQDDVKCPSTLMCSCSDCYFGDRCQFYAKGIGLTLDDILRYELRPNMTLSNQSTIIKCSAALTIIIFVAGLISSILTLLTFYSKKSRDVGCGIYLIASSITSFLTVTMFTTKFWFLLLTQTNLSVSYSTLRGGCISIEFILKACLYVDNWFNACVAIERAMTVHKGANFDKKLSKRIAKWLTFILPILMIVSILHEPLYRDLFNDKFEQRYWCVFHYYPSIQIYNTIIICFHLLGPFCANIFSAIFIIIATSRRRAVVQSRLTYNQHLHEQLNEHKNLLISPIILVILAIPRLLISIYSNCVKVSHSAWLYLIGYFVSFLPSISIFIVFVLPSEFYKEQFKSTIKFDRR